jgi:hypothetical protein
MISHSGINYIVQQKLPNQKPKPGFEHRRPHEYVDNPFIEPFEEGYII